MDSPSDISSRNMEENPGPSNDHPEAPPAPAVEDDHHEDREYECKFCNKKFSNKQALGGHQNAHKVERAIEKNARELHKNVRFGYFGSGSYPVMPHAPYLSSYNIRSSHDFVDRSVFNFSYNASPQQQQQQQQHGIRIRYNARPRLPLAGYPYGPDRPRLGFNNVYSGWSAPRPRNVPHQFQGQHGASYVQNHGLNFRFPNIGAGSLSNPGPFYQDLSGFGAPRFEPGGRGGNTNEAINNPGNDQQDEDDSGLDLSLKL